MGGGGSKDGTAKKSTRPVQNFRLLLLGSGGSGKSTVFKQMRIQKGVGIPEDQRKFLTKSMQQKMVSLARSVLRSGAIVDNDHYESNAEAADKVKEALRGAGITDEQMATIEEMADAKAKEALDGDEAASLLETVKAVWKAIADTQGGLMDDSLEAYIPTMISIRDRICSSDFLATDDDILFYRAPTVGLEEVTAEVQENVTFTFIDVGGQRSERKNWMKVQNITAVVFVGALDDFCKTLEEDQTKNAMKEALNVFRIVGKTFKNMPIILLLNKRDLFEMKIEKNPLNKCFKGYKGSNAEDAYEFICQEFTAAGDVKEGMLYVHKTCATDGNAMKKVFSSVEHVILNDVMRSSGLC
jgi:tape measure domain-containing protein